MTTPRPALLSLSKIASSKFILEQGDLRAVHEGTCQVGCTCVIVGRVENSSIHSFICSNNWPRAGAESRGVEWGHLPPLTCPNFFFFFLCVAVKGGDLIETVVSSA